MQLDFYKKNILIVDDNKANMMFLKVILQDEGYSSLFYALSALEAYKILEENRIDLILLDVMMPEIDGLQACKTIKQDSHYSQVPIIMITADNTDETLKKSFEAGANDYITKPVSQTNLKVRMDSQFTNAQKDTLILNQNRQLAINETVQMLAHQWRQPLTVITTTTLDISISYDLEELTAQDLKTSLTKINDTVHMLSNTLNEFLQISQLEKEVSSHNINRTIKKSLLLMHDQFGSNEITIETDLQQQKEILYYPNELIKILISIYTNSIEAFKNLSSQTKKYIKISTKQTDSHTSITVEDNAGGIKENLLPRVFEPYVSTKMEKNAVGLGLYNAYNILKESMNATIEISSQDSKTTLTITLPNE